MESWKKKTPNNIVFEDTGKPNYSLLSEFS